MNTMRRGGGIGSVFLKKNTFLDGLVSSFFVGGRATLRSFTSSGTSLVYGVSSAEGLDECNENGTPPPEGKPDALDERSTPHARKQEQNRRPERSRRQICARPTRTRGRASVRLVDRTIHAIRNPFVGVSERPPKSTQFELRWIKTRWRKRAIKSAGENRGRTRIGLNI